MATSKISQKSIKQLVKEGAAADLEKMSKRPSVGELSCIGISRGTAGMNGALFINRKTGKMYAITSRSSLLFEYV